MDPPRIDKTMKLTTRMMMSAGFPFSTTEVASESAMMTSSDPLE
jgi:hypothetical protein